jgi:hypothetical protein
MFMACIEEIPIISRVECNVSQESPCDIWYLDSRCSIHMTRNLELFSSLDKSVQTKVTLGTDIQVTILGKGSINILTKQGEQKVMPVVYYVYGLKHNLMSIGQLLRKGCRIYMKDNHCAIIDRYSSNQLTARIQMTSNKMFPLTLKPTKNKNTTQAIGKEKGAQLDIAFTTESACNSNE